MSRFAELLDALVEACFEYSVAAPLDAAARLVDVTAARAALMDYHRGLVESLHKTANALAAVGEKP